MPTTCSYSLCEATLAVMPAPMTEMTPAAIATLPAAAAQEVVQVFGSAFTGVYYFAAGLFAVGLVLSLLLQDVKLPSRAPVPVAGE